jgi:hypothetical protein
LKGLFWRKGKGFIKKGKRNFFINAMRVTKKKFFISLGILFLLLLIIGSKDKSEKSVIPENTGNTTKVEATARKFYMGFTPWPPDFSDQAVKGSYKFIDDHADIIAHHLDNGIPWQESLEGKEFSKHLRDQWALRKSNTTNDHKVYLAITPINTDRNGLAPYWGETDNIPLSEPWKSYGFNDERVKKAYLNYAIRAIEYFKPDYIATGIESNILISKALSKWNDYLELNEYIYKELKKKYPKLLIFNTIQYEHLRAIENDAKPNRHLQIPEVKKLMQNSDLFAISTYHFGTAHNPANSNYFGPALSFGKPLAVGEMGAMSKDITIFGNKIHANEQDQSEFINFILSEANKNNFLFVINFVNIDYDKLLGKLPNEVKEVAKAWVNTGLVRSDYSPKPALSVWDAYYHLPRR